MSVSGVKGTVLAGRHTTFPELFQYQDLDFVFNDVFCGKSVREREKATSRLSRQTERRASGRMPTKVGWCQSREYCASMNLGAYRASSQIWSRISVGRRGKSGNDLRSLAFEIGNGKE